MDLFYADEESDEESEFPQTKNVTTSNLYLSRVIWKKKKKETCLFAYPSA